MNVAKQVAWFALGAVLAWCLHGTDVRADAAPAVDRQLTERMVRALEAQAHATESLVRATERLHK